ncbi:rubredoxin [Roseospira navarrensis]|uniref:Rubredoxin n=1 Tax=Roseospira navarrensis TaxID=140058 RepID=A0A7X2D2K7_9PROT|nr:rubredoxin [Roseospira navarrensis]MQX36384.1 rubredoxin [Roseospira navarrensis]
MTPSRRSLLRTAPAALLGLLAWVQPGARPARATAATAATAEEPYDPLTQVWECTYNGCDPYYYHPDTGDPDNIAGSHPIPPGTAFEDLPDTWLCPVCGAPKRWFVKHG